MVEWRSHNGELPPAPDGPLRLTVRCSTGPRSRARHQITLHPDWSLETPHDLESERILAALGGSLSCIGLHDVVVPTVRELVQLSSQHRLGGVRRVGAQWWRVTSGGCRRCSNRRFAELRDAVRHERTVEHWLESEPMLCLDRVHRRILGDLYDAVGAAHREARAASADRSRPGPHPAVLEDHGPSELREVGIPAEFVEDVHHRVAPDGPALSTRFYVAAAYLDVDLAWLTDLASRRPDPDVLTWAAWSQTPLDRTDPAARLGWLELGVAPHDVARLMRAGYTPQDATRFAQASGRSPTRAAAVLAAWERIDCSPAPGDLIALERIVGGAWQPPSGGAIDLLLAELGETWPAATRTQVALVLAAVGTRPQALAALRIGARDPDSAIDRLEQLSHHRRSSA